MKYCIAGHPRGGVAAGRDPPIGGTADKVRKILPKIAALKAQYFCKKKKRKIFFKIDFAARQKQFCQQNKKTKKRK